MLLSYFNGTTVSSSLVLSSTGLLPVIIALNLKNAESGTVAFCSSL